MKIIKPIFFATIIVILLSSCGGKALLQKADKTYERGAYYEAIKQYRKAIPKVGRRQQVLANYKLGECYRILNQNSFAETTFARLVRRGDNVRDVLYRYTEVLVKMGKYEEAQKSIEAFARQHPEDPRIDNMRKTIALAQEEQPKIEKEYIVESFNIANSNYNDFCPMFATNDYETIFFSSSRSSSKKDKKRHAVTGERASNIYKTELSKEGKWQKAMKVEDLSSKRNEEGASSFNQSFSTLYITKTQGIYEDLAGVSIYSVNRDANYNWDEAQTLNIVPDSINVGQPSIAPDELSLYFVSDMPGGYGGLDIWKVTRTSGDDQWSEPINLGEKINTKADEMFPYIHKEEELYFSSTGHPGYGGLDIFKAVRDSIGQWNVVNMGQPFNSNADDFGIIFEGSTDNGYFTSSRKGGKGGDDIYRFYTNVVVIEHHIEGMLFDENRKTPIAGEVKIVGNNGSVLIRKVEKDGKFKCRLQEGTDYICIASAPKHLNQKLRFSTIDADSSTTIQDTIYLKPTDKPIEIPNIFYAFGKADLNPESREALDGLIEILRDNPTIVIELSAHTDNRGSSEVNEKLSQNRAQAVVDYLIKEGIAEERMVAKGYGKRNPKTVDKATAEKHTFLTVGRKLDEKYINTFKDDEEKTEICHQLNRRTEMLVIGETNKLGK